MTSRGEYLKALSATPAQPVTDELSIPGLPAGEYALPALWSIQRETAAMLGDGVEESLAEGRAFAHGTWDD